MEEGLEGTKLQLLAFPCCLRSKPEGEQNSRSRKSQRVTFASRDHD